VTHGSNAGGADIIGTSLTNNGTIQFADQLHTLSGPAMTYFQGAQGNLVMRVKAHGSGVANDSLFGFYVEMGGTLTINAQGTIPAGETWTIISTGLFGLAEAFATQNFPNDGNNWQGVADFVAGTYSVKT